MIDRSFQYPTGIWSYLPPPDPPQLEIFVGLEAVLRILTNLSPPSPTSSIIIELEIMYLAKKLDVNSVLILPWFQNKEVGVYHTEDSFFDFVGVQMLHRYIYQKYNRKMSWVMQSIRNASLLSIGKPQISKKLETNISKIYREFGVPLIFVLLVLSEEWL